MFGSEYPCDMPTPDPEYHVMSARTLSSAETARYRLRKEDDKRHERPRRRTAARFIQRHSVQEPTVRTIEGDDQPPSRHDALALPPQPQ